MCVCAEKGEKEEKYVLIYLMIYFILFYFIVPMYFEFKVFVWIQKYSVKIIFSVRNNYY